MLVIASRGSQLALWQAHWVESQLQAAGHECRIEIIKTTGDKITDVPLAKVGTKGLFTKEIEEALLDGRADVAVHSLKDLPTELPEAGVLEDIEGIGEALDRLGDLEPRLAQIVDLKFFCGFSFEEIAGLLGVSTRTAQRDWDKARILLHRDLDKG